MRETNFTIEKHPFSKKKKKFRKSTVMVIEIEFFFAVFYKPYFNYDDN